MGCLGSVLLTMVLSGALIWALNPEMSAREAAREGILWGGGLSVAFTALACGLPLLLIGGLVVFVLLRKRRVVQGRASGPTVIDVDSDD